MNSLNKVISYIHKVREGAFLNSQLKKDQTVDYVDRKIIEAWDLLQKSSFESLVKILTSLKGQVSLEQKALILFTLAVCDNNRGEYTDALTKMLKVEQMINEKLELDPNHKFLSLLEDNILVTLLNLNQVTEFAKRLDLLKEKDELKRYEYFEIIYNCHIGNISKTKMLLSNFYTKRYQLEEPKKVLLYISLFELGVQEKSSIIVLDALKKMSKLKKFAYSDNFKFMKSMSDYFFNDNPLYLYPNDFKRNPFLRQQVEIVLALDKNDEYKAFALWDSLHKNYPHLFGVNLKWKGPVCIFSLVLNKIKQKTKEPADIKLEMTKSLSAKEEMVIKILKQNGSISKEQLYQQLYDEEMRDKKDLEKLARLISRLREKYQLNIKTSKGCYLISA
jgi:hypothetical protein